MAQAGLLLWSLYGLLEGAGWAGGALYTCVVHAKHLYVFCGPMYALHLLRGWCGGGLRGVGRLLLMAVTVAAISAASLGPFYLAGQLEQVRNECGVI